MSPKELSYIDDCLGHLVFLDSLCKELNTQVQDNDMKQLVKEATTTFQKQFTCLYKLVGGNK